MTTSKRYPLVEDVPHERRRKRWHPEVEVTWGAGQTAVRFCGNNGCSGECGHPALVITPRDAAGVLRKASGSQVATGDMMQYCRAGWDGERVEVPAAHRADFLKRMWW